MMENKTVAERIKQECMVLLSNKNIFSNCSVEFIDKYRKLYSSKHILSIVTNEELVQTAQIFLKNNLNITLASKVGYMHRNTLIYRIEKIKRVIGLDIRIFEEAVVFDNLVMFYELVKNYN